MATLTTDDVATLERWARRPTTAQALAQRVRIVSACATQYGDYQRGAVNRLTVGRWRRRFFAKEARQFRKFFTNSIFAGL